MKAPRLISHLREMKIEATCADPTLRDFGLFREATIARSAPRGHHGHAHACYRFLEPNSKVWGAQYLYESAGAR
jgi:hypothetical protein